MNGEHSDVIIGRPTLHDYRIEITRRGRKRQYYLGRISDDSAMRLCNILNRMRPDVEWDGYTPTVYYFAHRQENNR